MASSDVLDALRTAHDELASQYRTHIGAVRELQRTLLMDVLPGVLDELGIDSVETEESAREWLSDTESIFRLLRRHKFTRTFALQAARNTLEWRLKTLHTTSQPSTLLPSALTLSSFPTSSKLSSDLLPETDHVCLLPTRDPLGRPLVLLPALALCRPDTPTAEATRQAAVVALADALRTHLAQLNAAWTSPFGDVPVLQYSLVLDAHGLSIRNLDVELLRWFAAEVQPRFSGLIGAVFVTNYSWTQSGVWSVARRLLPRAALARVSFLGPKSLVQLLGAHALPHNYGGTLQSSPPTPPPTPPLVKRERLVSTPQPARTTVVPHYVPPPPQTWKNLLRTLARLWWRRWGGVMRWLVAFLLLIIAGRRLAARQLQRRR